jgi:hypothetical protein
MIPQTDSRSFCLLPAIQTRAAAESVGILAKKRTLMGEASTGLPPMVTGTGQPILRQVTFAIFTREVTQSIVSRNSRDDGYLANRTTSQNWGSDIHIVSHTNAVSGGCGSSSSNYLYTAYNQTASDKPLATDLGTQLNPDVPSTWTQVQRTDLSELSTNATYGDAYVEIQFHTYQPTQSWLFSQYIYATADYGIGVDVRLNYP